MSRRSSTLPLGALALGALSLSLVACGPKPTAPPESGSQLADATPAAAPESEAAPESSAAPASEAAAPESEAAAAPAPAAGATAAPPGMIALQVKDTSGKPVFGNPDSGKQVFVICSACHSIQAGQNMVGPSLHGIVGRHSGIVPGFHYSSANKNSGLVWTEQELYVYLENPQKTVPGTYMTYTGVKDPQQRADVIAYLQQATK